MVVGLPVVVPVIMASHFFIASCLASFGLSLSKPSLCITKSITSMLLPFSLQLDEKQKAVWVFQYSCMLGVLSSWKGQFIRFCLSAFKP